MTRTAATAILLAATVLSFIESATCIYLIWVAALLSTVLIGYDIWADSRAAPEGTGIQCDRSYHFPGAID